MGKSVAFHNLGCKVNSYETEKMMKELAEKGYDIIPFDQKADIYIINTCSVTNIADRKTRQMLNRARRLNPDAVIVAAGCYVNTRRVRSVIPEEADICVSNEEKRDIAGILDGYFAGREKTESDNGCRGDLPEDALHTRCFIKVQDGCNQFCSYCIIPYARGRICSRTVREIIEETRQYVKAGYKEFVPTGIHISSFGKDREADHEDLLGLLRAMSETEGVERIRLSSLEPRTVTEEFAAGLREIKQICPHFHLSLQSGSDTVLKRMNRRYTTDEYAEAVDILRGCFDDPAITTDIITGFPGETETEFEETVGFVQRMNFYETHVFKFSRRRGTAADRMEGQLTEAVKHERSVVLMKINAEKKREFEDRHIKTGARAEVLFEDLEEAGGRILRSGYTREYLKVYDERGAFDAGDIAEGSIRRQGEVILFERT